ncbi:MAG TPA: hypothetical protein VJR71_13765 [Pseudolabrys sp.]|nr:hypothetical protein [Pseudolabrys sp.]
MQADKKSDYGTNEQHQNIRNKTDTLLRVRMPGVQGYGTDACRDGREQGNRRQKRQQLRIGICHKSVPDEQGELEIRFSQKPCENLNPAFVIISALRDQRVS